MSELQGILLCSGSGSRMSCLSEDTAKPMLPVIGVPMFLYPLSTLLRAGVRDIKIFVREAVRHVAQKATKSSGIVEKFSANVEFIAVSGNQEDFGTADLIRHHLNKITKDAIIVSCDFVSDSSLIPFIEFFRTQNATLLALVSDHCVYAPSPGPKTKKVKATDLMGLDESSGRMAYLCGDEDFDGVLHCEKFAEKFPKLSLTSKFNDCHVYAIRHSALQLLSKNKNFVSFKADFVPFLLDEQFEENSKINCFAYRIPHENGSVTAHANTVGAYFEVNKAILKSFSRLWPLIGNGKNFNYREDKIAMNDSRVDSSSQVGKDSVIKRCVIMEKCKIGEKTKLKENLIFDNVIIGNGATVSNSIICEGAEIGENAEIINSIVTREQKVSQKSKIQNEIVEEDDEEWAND